MYPGQNSKSGYFLKKVHSIECCNTFQSEKKEIKEKILNKNNFILECENIMNSSNIFDRRLFKEEFKKLYSNKDYDFPLSNNILSNIISNWKRNSLKLTKYCIFQIIYDYENSLILRGFTCKYNNVETKKVIQKVEYNIWAKDENIRRMRKSNHYYIDATFHHPPEYKELLIFMYKDTISNVKFLEFMY